MSLTKIHHDLWSALGPLQKTLAYLDIYQQTSPSSSSSSSSRAHNTSEEKLDFDFCCPLKRFTNLRTLSITPLLLRGNCSRHKPPLQLLNHLPLDLDSLTIYDSDRDWDWDSIEDFEIQLETIPRHKYTRLSSIVVVVPPLMGDGRLPYRRMERWAKAKGIDFKTGRGFLLPFGGRDSWFGRWTYKVLKRRLAMSRNSRPEREKPQRFLRWLSDA